MKKFILIGYGSIGKFHLSKINQSEVYIVDPKLNSEYLTPNELKTNNIFTFTNLTQLPKTSYSGAVIANWGPDHLATVRKLRKLGVKNFILEKPLVDSLWHLKLLSSEKRKYNLNISVHLQWNYSGVFEKLHHHIESFNLGQPTSAVVFGGAKCLVMNGIHYLALTNKIFGTSPILVSGILKSSRINPRGNNFLYYEGNLSYSYPHNKFLSMVFSNSSRISAEFFVILERGLARLHGNILEIYRINGDSMRADNRVVKTFPADELIYKGDAFLFSDYSDGSDLIYRSFIAGREVQDSYIEGVEATKWLINGLKSGTKNYFSFNLFSFFRRWNIT